MGREEDVLDPQAVQVVQVVLKRRKTGERQSGMCLLFNTRQASHAKPHRLREVGVKLQHVVELLLKLRRLQSFVLIVLQEIRLKSKEPKENSFIY